MNIKTNSILMLTTVLLIPACSVLDSSYQFESVYPDTPKVYIKQLTAREVGNQVVVSGKLKKRSLTTWAPQGHVDITVYNIEGELLTEVTTSYSSSLNIRSVQKRGGNRFSATLDIVPPPGSLIKVAFHPDEFKPRPNPGHEVNIAR